MTQIGHVDAGYLLRAQSPSPVASADPRQRLDPSTTAQRVMNQDGNDSVTDDAGSLSNTPPELANQLHLLELAVDAAPVPILVTGAEPGQIVFANAACLRLWGASRLDSTDDIASAMCRRGCDSGLVRELWEQLVDGERVAGTHGSLLLRDARLVRWRVTPLSEGPDESRSAVHVFEEVEIEPTRLRERSDLFRLTFDKAGVGM